MAVSIESVLYIDIQAQPPRMLCPVCGGEIYHLEGLCLRCERRCRDAV